jgi:predicted AlkP superfamily pyrophosphatase or phosphodiesterase
VVLVASGSTTFLGCHERKAAGTPQLIVIGIDGADWNMVDPLIADGRLPNLASLIERGVRGSLETLEPTLSPIIWTTIATGYPPEVHGITGFLDPRNGVPFTSNARRVPAFWQLVSEAGLRVSVVGWWVSWPAEPVEGAIVSAYSSAGGGIRKGTLHAKLERQTYPASLLDELRPKIAPGLAHGQQRIAELRAASEPLDPPAPSLDRVGAWVFGADRMFTAAAVHLLARERPDVLGVYLAAPDVIAHQVCVMRKQQLANCKDLLGLAYDTVDENIGRVLAAARADATVLVVSDHGFLFHHGHAMAPPGMLVLSGPRVDAGRQLAGASVFDVLPTILGILGAPLARDLPGQPLAAAFRGGTLPTPPAPPIATFVPAEPIGGTPSLAAPTDEAMKERLRVLGYID